MRKARFNWLIKVSTCTITEQLLLRQELNLTGVFFHLRSVTPFFASGMVYIRDFNLLILLELFPLKKKKKKAIFVNLYCIENVKKILPELTFLEFPSNMPVLSSLFLFCALQIVSIVIAP